MAVTLSCGDNGALGPPISGHCHIEQVEAVIDRGEATLRRLCIQKFEYFRSRAGPETAESGGDSDGTNHDSSCGPRQVRPRDRDSVREASVGFPFASRQ